MKFPSASHGQNDVHDDVDVDDMCWYRIIWSQELFGTEDLLTQLPPHPGSSQSHPNMS